jgi:uncharacterized membrane protein (DUF485 family)
MKPNRILRIVLGLVTLVPLVYLGTFLVYLSPRLAQLARDQTQGRAAYYHLFSLVLQLHVAAVFVVLILMGVYAVLAYKAPGVPSEKRTSWMVAVCMGSIVVMPVFWYLYVWRSVGGRSRHQSVAAAGAGT